jgi:cytochrome oxidase Cu insertion factor (SCO1/SenC/PrrC family)
MELALLAAVVAAGFGPLQATPDPAPFDPGPAVGARVPDFDLTDQDGRRRTFESLRGPEGLVLVFFRSADW